jgi:hypothetical protein
MSVQSIGEKMYTSSQMPIVSRWRLRQARGEPEDWNPQERHKKGLSAQHLSMKNGQTAPMPTASIADLQMDRGCACSLGGCKFNPFE